MYPVRTFLILDKFSIENHVKYFEVEVAKHNFIAFIFFYSSIEGIFMFSRVSYFAEGKLCFAVRNFSSQVITVVRNKIISLDSIVFIENEFVKKKNVLDVLRF